jgi:hypothetical protein
MMTAAALAALPDDFNIPKEMSGDYALPSARRRETPLTEGSVVISNVSIGFRDRIVRATTPLRRRTLIS